MAIELRPFDPADYLKGEDIQLELLTEALATGDRQQIAHAIGTVARARGGLTKLEEATGMKRQMLNRALGPNGNPTLETLLKVLDALGVTLTAHARAA